MRVGFIVDSAKKGGAEKQTLLLAEGLMSKGYTVVFFALNDAENGILRNDLGNLGIDFFDLEFVYTSSHIQRTINCIKLSLKLKKYKLDILMPYTLRPNVNVNFAWQLTGAQACFWNQRDEGRGFSKKYRDKILWWSLKNTSAIISNSLEGAEFIKNYIPSSKEIRKINNGIFIRQPSLNKEDTLQKFKLNVDHFHVLMIANLTKYKDHKTLLKAWHIFLSKCDQTQKLVLLLAGQKAEMYQELLALAAQLKIETSVKFLGVVEDVNSLVHAVDLCVFSSVKEGVPNGVLEGMAAGKPVIATSIMGNGEALGNDYPYLCAPNDAEAFANHIFELYNAQDKRKSVGLNNCKRIKEFFSPKTLVLDTLDFIQNPHQKEWRNKMNYYCL